MSYGKLFKTKSLEVLSNFLHTSLFRYSINGIFLNTLGFLIYLFLTYLRIDPKLAMSITYIFFLIIGFFWHKQFSFMSSNIVPSKFRFLLVHFSAYFINLALLFLFVDLLQFKHQYVQGFTIILVAIYLYLMLNRIVFKTVNNTKNNHDSI
jgi:putative flippase GtrA